MPGVARGGGGEGAGGGAAAGGGADLAGHGLGRQRMRDVAPRASVLLPSKTQGSGHRHCMVPGMEGAAKLCQSSFND